MLICISNTSSKFNWLATLVLNRPDHWIANPWLDLFQASVIIRVDHRTENPWLDLFVALVVNRVDQRTRNAWFYLFFQC